MHSALLSTILCFSFTNIKLELALDVEVAMPYFIQRMWKCVVKYERVYPNEQTNVVAKFMRKVMEGPLCKEVISDEVLGRELVSKILWGIGMSEGL